MEVGGAFFGASSQMAWLSAMYRPIIIFCIGLWGWGWNLFLLDRQHIDTSLLLQLHGTEKSKPFRAVWLLTAIFASIILTHVWWSWLARNDSSLSRWIPISCHLIALVVLFWRGQSCFRKERIRFLKTLGRLLSFNLFSSVYFADIILADILTSFSVVFGDLYGTLCVTCTQSTLTNACFRNVLSPLLISLPYVIRLRQCLSEYIESSGQCKRHLFNALKYFTALPVILLSSVQKAADYHIAATGELPNTWWINETHLFRLWLLCAFVNSMYSFWWDISVDWHFVHVSTQPTGSSSITLYKPLSVKPVIRTRQQLAFGNPVSYYAAVGVDLLLRTTWCLKLIPLEGIRRLNDNIFVMALLEVARRWMWVIFRMESEWIKRIHGGFPTSTIRLQELDTFERDQNNVSGKSIMI